MHNGVLTRLRGTDPGAGGRKEDREGGRWCATVIRKITRAGSLEHGKRILVRRISGRGKASVRERERQWIVTGQQGLKKLTHADTSHPRAQEPQEARGRSAQVRVCGTYPRARPGTRNWEREPVAHTFGKSPIAAANGLHTDVLPMQVPRPRADEEATTWCANLPLVWFLCSVDARVSSPSVETQLDVILPCWAFSSACALFVHIVSRHCHCRRPRRPLFDVRPDKTKRARLSFGKKLLHTPYQQCCCQCTVHAVGTW